MPDPAKPASRGGFSSEAHSSDLTRIVARHAHGVALIHGSVAQDATYLLAKGRNIVIGAMKEMREALCARGLL